MPEGCPVAYDHNDELDRCEVCGWSGDRIPYAPRWANVPRWLWPDYALAPTYPVTLCAPEEDHAAE